MNKQQKPNGSRGIEWTPIPRHEGYYATRDGLIGSEWMPTRNGSKRGFQIKPLTQRNNGHGYLIVKFRQRLYTVHRLICITFIGICPAGYQVCHNDGNKKNNHVSNLRYDTAKGNALDKIKHGTSTRGEANNTAKLTEEKALNIRRAEFLAGDTLNNTEIAEKLGVHHTTIWNIRAEKTWKYLRAGI